MEHFNINGSLFLAFANYASDTAEKFNTDSFIYKFNDSTGKFFLYQTIGTNGGLDVKYFTISGEHYLAVANSFNGITHRLNSVIYRWNGTLLVAFQNIATNGGDSFDFFEIAKKPFLAISNVYNDFTNRINSSIYEWRRNRFAKFQAIETNGGREIAAFVINNESYIAFANAAAHSVVYKWSGKKFFHLQKLPNAMDLKSFYVNDHAFLALASTVVNASSSIYKWNGNQFVLFQSIPARRARGFHPFVMCDQTFLAVADRYNTNSTLYRFSQGKFTKYQEISTVGAIEMTSFEYRGHTYLAVANSRNKNQMNIKSTVYKWI